jgi:hypothetical protein
VRVRSSGGRQVNTSRAMYYWAVVSAWEDEG